MFFIFGWGHAKVEDLGPVQQHTCGNCHNTEIWHLKTTSRYFTLFFIPVFRHDVEHFYHCPICNYGVVPDKAEYEGYRAIAKANTDCLEGTITESERLVLLEKIEKDMRVNEEEKQVKAREDSRKWVTVVGEKTTLELERILSQTEQEYDAGFILAAKEEVLKRKGATG